MLLNCRTFTLTVLLVYSLFPATKSDLAADKSALIRFSAAVGGRTRRWNQTDPNPCSWTGVTCDNTTGRVTQLRLPGAGLIGEIPLNTVGNLTGLQILSLRRNSLSGSIPFDLNSCTELQQVYLQYNRFSGEIPSTLSRLTNLVWLNLAGNQLTGRIPPEFNGLANLQTLELESNRLTGSIPELNTNLGELNVSHNQLNGSIPKNLKRFPTTSFLGNSLCGSPLNACPGAGNKLSAGAIAGIVTGSFVGLIATLVALFFLWRKFTNQPKSGSIKRRNPPEFEFSSPNPILVRRTSGASTWSSRSARSKTGEVSVVKRVVDKGLVFFGEGAGGFGLEELLRASAEVLGKGTFAMTYSAYLEGGQRDVVVKRLKNVCVGEGEFREMVEGWGGFVHENLMPLKGYYFGKEEKFLVYDFMPMGSLSTLLHGNGENGGGDGVLMTWEMRIKIALEASGGIEYLHSIDPNISHGNIRSSNILLTDIYTPCISEYCINQLVSSTPTLKVNGYCAPEVSNSQKVSQKADVYSFGVVLLELLTGKVPTHTLSNKGVDMPRWAHSVVQEKWTIDVFDPRLVMYRNREEPMVQLLHLGIHCTFQQPEKRPSMAQVTQRIRDIVWSS